MRAFASLLPVSMASECYFRVVDRVGKFAWGMRGRSLVQRGGRMIFSEFVVGFCKSESARLRGGCV